jgi:GAF domain-containing protein
MAKRGQALRRSRAIKRPANQDVDLKQENAALKRELAQEREQRAATSDALTATADVLKVISRSTFDLQTVLETLAASAVRLCSAERGLVFRFDGHLLWFRAGHNVSSAFRDFLERNPITLGRSSNAGRAALERGTVHNLDVREDPEYSYGGSRVDPYRTVLAVPMVRGDQLFGVFVIYRHEVRAFTDTQIALMETFADQAVIAIENTRHLTEQREALEQQTATAEVLQVINSSPGDLAPVFNAMLEKATRLCEAARGQLAIYDGEFFRFVAAHGEPAFVAQQLAFGPRPPTRGVTWPRIVRGERVVHFADVKDTDLYRAGHESARRFVDVGGGRSLLTVALRKEEQLLGALTIYRQEVRPFSDKEIVLVQNFAAQAVIAMENARLITETREALEQQTATADVLGVINASPGKLEPVFDAMLEKALRLCQAAFGILRLYDGSSLQLAAERGVPESFLKFIEKKVGTAAARAVDSKRVVHIVDLMDTDLYRSGDPYRHAMVELAGARTLLLVPLLKDDAVRGIFTIYRQEVRPFSDKQIALLQNFAAQAVIAMENAQLITETREALEQQTATSEVLQVINSSPGDLAPVFDAILEKAHNLCSVAEGGLMLYDGAEFRAVAVRGVSEAFAHRLRQGYIPGPNHPSRQLLEGARFAQITDWAEIDHPISSAALDAGLRTTLFIPLRKDGTLLGQITANRREVRPFTEKEIALLESFAAQAVIAMENARLLGSCASARRNSRARSTNSPRPATCSRSSAARP